VGFPASKYYNKQKKILASTTPETETERSNNRAGRSVVNQQRPRMILKKQRPRIFPWIFLQRPSRIARWKTERDGMKLRRGREETNAKRKNTIVSDQAVV
jgi:hypothetical protein